MVKLAGIVEDMVKCNNAVDIYEQYFPEVGRPLTVPALHAKKFPFQQVDITIAAVLATRLSQSDTTSLCKPCLNSCFFNN